MRFLYSKCNKNKDFFENNQYISSNLLKYWKLKERYNKYYYKKLLNKSIDIKCKV